MILAIRIKLNPTKEQEVLFWKSAGTARWAYNYYLNANNKYYAEHKMPIKEGDVRKEINNVLKPTTHTWLSEVGSNVMKQAVKDADEARKRWLDGISAKPKFKSRHKSEPKWFPSSKICSCCGKKKTDLKLSDRVFVCSHCDLKLDRDLNAAINLANYQIREA